MRRVALALSAATAALALAACSGGAGDVEEGSAPPEAFTTPAWAMPVDPQGEWLTSMATDEVRVDVYLVGIEPAPEDSSWANEDDSPVFVAGDDVLLLQWVLTNVGDEELTLSSGGGDAGLDYVGNEYVSVPNENALGDLLLAHGVPDDSIDFATYEGDDFDVPLAPGESATQGEVFWHPAGEELLFDYRLDRFVDGEPDYDQPVIDASIPLTLP